jgi:hypothetical protein
VAEAVVAAFLARDVEVIRIDHRRVTVGRLPREVHRVAGFQLQAEPLNRLRPSAVPIGTAVHAANTPPTQDATRVVLAHELGLVAVLRRNKARC